MPIHDLKFPFFCSWSGGKDSSLALYRAIKNGAQPQALLTMMIETGNRSRSHGISLHILKQQAHLMGIPIRFCSTSWQTYEQCFIEEVHSLKKSGIENGVFGDIDIDAHRLWVEKVCAVENIKPWLPLWKEERIHLLNEFLEAGFCAQIIAVKEDQLPPHFLGKILNEELIQEFTLRGIDLCGEAGEYHTLVTDGPLFTEPLHISQGSQVLRDGYWFLDLHRPLGSLKQMKELQHESFTLFDDGRFYFYRDSQSTFTSSS